MTGGLQSKITDFRAELARMRFFSRLFSEALHLRVTEVLFLEEQHAALVEFRLHSVLLKTITLQKGEPAALLAWLKRRQLKPEKKKIFFGAISAGYAACLKDGAEAATEMPTVGVISDLSHLSRGTLVGMDDASALELAARRTPGILLAVHPDAAGLAELRHRLIVGLGWLDGGVLGDATHSELMSAAMEFPLIVGVQASSTAEAITRLSLVGVDLAGTLRGLVLDTGTTTNFYPPFGAEAQRAARIEERRAAKPIKVAKMPTKPRILVVEDDPDQREILELMLATQGVETVAASNGVEALEILRVNPVNVVVTDLMMPILDGRQLLQSIRRDPKFKDLPVVILSVIDDEARERELLKLGADDYCVKTAQPKIFLERIQKLLKGRGKV